MNTSASIHTRFVCRQHLNGSAAQGFDVRPNDLEVDPVVDHPADIPNDTQIILEQIPREQARLARENEALRARAWRDGDDLREARLQRDLVETKGRLAACEDERGVLLKQKITVPCAYLNPLI